MFIIIFQTFAYLQIFNIFNARRPSVKDLNPFAGISILTCLAVILLLGFQFSLLYLPTFLGYKTIDEYSNLICMGLGAASLIWLFFCKAALRFFISKDDSNMA